MSFSHKQNKNKRNTASNSDKKGARFLITINVFGSAGPLRFVVNGDDHNVSHVIQTALKIYAHEDRLPILGSDINSFLLYPSNSGFDALELSEYVGSLGVRNFVLCKKQSINNKPHMTQAIDRKRISGWRTWLHRSFSLKILLSH